MRPIIALAALLALVPVASAQGEAGLGQPIPDESLVAGQVSVKVVLGQMSRPATSLPVSLVDEASGKERVVRTDANGRALFRDLPAGARYSAYAKVGDKEVASEPMTIPSEGGLRVVLSPTPIQEAPGAPAESGEMPPGHPGGGGQMAGMPDPRQMSGVARPEPGDPAGSLTVRTIQGKFKTDPIKGRVADVPAGAVVHLVGYGSGAEITLDSQPVDEEGRVTFEKLATDNSVSYYALATFERAGVTDRLQSSSLEMPPQVGLRLMLAGPGADSDAPPVDDLPIFRQRPDTRLPAAGQVIVELAGQPQRIEDVELVEVAGDRVVATTKVGAAGGGRRVSGNATVGPDSALRDRLVQVQVAGPSGALPGVAIRIVRQAADSAVAAEGTTDAQGRIDLQDLPAGETVVVTATLDGQSIDSQPFEIPASGGVKVTYDLQIQTVAAAPVARFDGVAHGPDKIYYARTRSDGQVYLSPPFQMVPGRGAVVGILIYPQLLFGFQGGAELDDDRMWFQLRIAIANPSLTPLATGKEGLLIPLPPGFIGASVEDEMASRVKVDPDHGLIWRGSFPPGQREFMTSFALPVEGGDVHFSMPLPFGLWDSHIVLEDFPGAELDVPASAQRDVRETPDGRRFILLSKINIRPGQSLEFEVRGLPQAPTWKRVLRIVAGVGVLILLVWGFGSALATRRRNREAAGEETLEDRRERLLAKVVALDQKADKGRISAGEHSRRRAALIEELEEVYREIDARSAG